MASFSACTEPVSLMAMVPVTECKMPTVTSVSVTARPVVLTLAVGNCWASAVGASIAVADSAAAPTKSSRRVGVESPGILFRDDIATPLSSLVGRVALALAGRLRRFVAMQHTSIDVYAYVGRRTKSHKTWDSGKCGESLNRAFRALFCSAHCLVFRHTRPVQHVRVRRTTSREATGRAAG